MIISRVEPRYAISYCVKVGYRQPWELTGSGRAIAAFQASEKKERMLNSIKSNYSKVQFSQIVKQVKTIEINGYEQSKSSQVQSVIDLSAPIIQSGIAIGAFTIPYITHTPIVVCETETLLKLKALAINVSKSVSEGEIACF